MGRLIYHLDIEKILDRAANEETLTHDEILMLLSIKSKKYLQRLFTTARSLRNRYFNNKIFLYGFVYFSTWCKNSCTFCAYRSSNDLSPRYRKSNTEIWEVVLRLQESGVHLVDLTMGEDPFFHRTGGFERLQELVSKIKRETKLAVMISPGVVSGQTLKDFASVGVDWYACYQETYNRKLFGGLRAGQSFQQRLISKYRAAQFGLLVEEGLLLGVGETRQDLAFSLEKMRAIGAHQVRAMSFVPQKGIPLENVPSPERQWELIVIAVLRILFPDKLIPASLDVDGIDGLTDRLAAGANVVTSLIPANAGLAGVAQHKKDINEGYRTVAGVTPILQAEGLEVASPAEYNAWINGQKEDLAKQLLSKRWKV